ncbi:MAG TPA: alpha/beta fold hydrolase [Ilumatobacter sp.]|nr:alpha/beta fold hydrolase [Ilumatobacter sp.]
MNAGASTADVIAGCEAWSHVAGSSMGVLVVHGFTGTPASVRSIAEAMAAAGYDVELPRLPGHGTSVEDMLTTAWDAWSGEVSGAVERLSSRVSHVVAVGQSMGGTLVLRAALGHPAIGALVCINPLTRVRDAETMAMLDDLLEDGISVAPGEGSDIADPDAYDVAYAGTPIAPLKSLLLDGVAPIADRYGELSVPLRLFTSRNDHVVDPADSEYLAATYGGPVEHTWLERSYHVATRDYDRDLIVAESSAFVARVAT